MDVLELLARDDKWYLGSGDGTIFAPPFPQWLDAPGFWDHASVYQYQFGPLFTVTILDAEGRELPMRARQRRWTAAELTIEYELPDGMRARESRTVHPRGVFASEWVITSEFDTRLHAVGWTAQDTAQLALKESRWDGQLSFVRQVLDRRQIPMDVRAELTATMPTTSYSATLSEKSALQPHWRFTPFRDQWVSDRLPGRIRLEGINTDGLFYGAVHVALRAAAEHRVGFAMRLTPQLDGGQPVRRPTPLNTSILSAQVRPTPTDVSAVPATGGGAAVSPGSLGRASRRRWQEWFAGVPAFSCSDPYLERYYWYRWYGLFLNALHGGVGNYRWPTVCEGIDFFHEPITYSAQCHVRELRWRHDPEWARGVLRTIFDRQRPDGSLHGRIYVNHLQGTDFYHANWGDAFEALDQLHPDDAFASDLYPGLSRHAEWLVSTRDPDATGMFDVIDQYETGQEYMSRYQAVDPSADRYGWENRIRLKGIDVTVYAYALFRALERLAPRVGLTGEGRHWAGYAVRTARAVREIMWNPERGMFSDVDPRSMQRTNVAAAVCFYPYFTDLATEAHLKGLLDNLRDPARFWTPFPVPSSSVDDPLYSATAEWKGKRHVCPWNGRVWPMTNSHVMEALLRWATPDRPLVRETAAHLLQRFVRMMFHDGDVARPNCFEHYNPDSGTACQYRGIDDYQHSWVLDLILRGAAGLRISRESIVVDPLPLGLESFEVRRVRVDHREVSVRLADGYLTVTAGDDLRVVPVGTPVVIPR